MVEVGKKIQAKITFTQVEFDAFARLSGDDNPIHVDPGFAAQTHFGRTVAHGMLLYSVICGVISRHYPGARQLSQRLMFPAPTFAGEPMTIFVEPAGIDAAGGQKRLKTWMVNPDGEETVTGEAVILP